MKSLETSNDKTQVESNSIVRSLKIGIMQLFPTKTPERGSMSPPVIETDFLSVSGQLSSLTSDKGIPGESFDFTKDPNHNFGAFSDPVQQMKCVELVQKLKEQIQKAQCGRRCQLMVPHNFIQRISCDIIRMSECEPCGLRGCVLYVNLERSNKTHKLGKFQLDPETITTFEIFLTLKEDTKKWTFQLKNLIRPIVFNCLLDHWSDEVFISPGYQLIKNKLYRPNH